MNIKSLLLVLAGVAAGFFIGFAVANSLNRNAGLTQTIDLPNNPPLNQPNAQPNRPGEMMPDVAETLDKAKNGPNSFAAQMKAGDMYAQIGRPEKAIEFYEAGVKLNPTDLQANLVLANSYFDSKQYENAEKHYAKVLEINPKDINARTDLATTLVERQNPDYDRAIKEFQQSLAIDPKHEPTLYNLAVAYSRKGDTENAKKTLTQLEQANPNSQLIGKLKQVFSQK